MSTALKYPRGSALPNGFLVLRDPVTKQPIDPTSADSVTLYIGQVDKPVLTKSNGLTLVPASAQTGPGVLIDWTSADLPTLKAGTYKGTVELVFAGEKRKFSGPVVIDTVVR